MSNITNLLKALTSRMLSIKTSPDVSVRTDPEPLSSEELNDHEPWGKFSDSFGIKPTATKTVIPVPVGVPVGTPVFFESCVCGYVHKSTSSCPKCEFVRKQGGEAAPIWKR